VTEVVGEGWGLVSGIVVRVGAFSWGLGTQEGSAGEFGVYCYIACSFAIREVV
jgi:hypothetical protein